MNPLINPATVKALREQRGWSQEQLVRAVNHRSLKGKGLSKRQLQRIEKAADSVPSIAVHESTWKSLALAFGVNPQTLQNPLEDSPSEPSEGTTELKVNVRLSTLTKFDLVRSTYCVDLEWIIELAPLMFVFHAESSLRERKKMLEQRREFYENFTQTFPQIRELIGKQDDRTFDEIQAEELSINSADILGRGLEHEDVAGLEICDNPFTLYLQRLSRRFGDRSKLEVDDSDPGFSAVPSYTVCTAHLDDITGGEARLKDALFSREIRVDNIPLCSRLSNDSDQWLRCELDRLRSAEASHDEDSI